VQGRTPTQVGECRMTPRAIEGLDKLLSLSADRQARQNPAYELPPKNSPDVMSGLFFLIALDARM